MEVAHGLLKTLFMKLKATNSFSLFNFEYFYKKSKQIGLVLTMLGQFEEIRSKFWDFSKNNHSF
jgi:hypothetical protein